MSQVTVVGIGADGWSGLGERQQALVGRADVLIGSPRQLGLIPDAGQDRRGLPSPLREELPALLKEYDGRAVVVLASGDPLVSGIATALLDLGVPVTIEPAVSSISLARARMGWPAESHATVSVVGRDVDLVRRELAPGRRILVLSSDETTPKAVASLLVELGYSASGLTALGDLGSPSESRHDGIAATWSAEAPRLHVLAIECVGPVLGSWLGGLPDDVFEHDGQLTKRDLRASALSRLAPQPGQLLWDVGAGAGSVGIEWLRAHPTCRAIAIEGDQERAARITRNAARLGVPGLEVRQGRAPDALAGLAAPDAVFVGGGATMPGVLDACRRALRDGGRLVVHGVTLETEALLAKEYAERGGELTRISVETTAPIGSFTGWTPARTVTQWTWTKEQE
jgi:precorrin-6Y C5,15-methyltransferase (decarboxylating)